MLLVMKSVLVSRIRLAGLSDFGGVRVYVRSHFYLFRWKRLIWNLIESG